MNVVLIQNREASMDSINDKTLDIRALEWERVFSLSVMLSSRSIHSVDRQCCIHMFNIYGSSNNNIWDLYTTIIMLNKSIVPKQRIKIL